MDEQIVVAPRRAVFHDEAHAFHGLLPLDAPSAPAVLDGLCAAPRHARRGDVEEDPSLLQPIPYVVLARTGPDGARELFAYARLVGGGERRLHGKLSIGVGGHMNRLFDRDTLAAVVREEAGRELVEELHLRDGEGGGEVRPEVRLVGLINDDTDPVQQVHIGLLALAEVPAGVEVTVRETDQLEGRWESLAALRDADLGDRLEKWSHHALAALAG